MTAVELRNGLRNGTLRLRGSYPAHDVLASEFQQRRRERIYALLDLYLREGKTVMELAEVLGCRHQAVSQHLRAGVEILRKTGWIVEVAKNAPPKRPRAASPAAGMAAVRIRSG